MNRRNFLRGVMGLSVVSVVAVVAPNKVMDAGKECPDFMYKATRVWTYQDSGANIHVRDLVIR
jgi:hypothetical protein